MDLVTANKEMKEILLMLEQATDEDWGMYQMKFEAIAVKAELMLEIFKKKGN